MIPEMQLQRPGALTGLRDPLVFMRYPFLALGARSEPIWHQGREGDHRFFLDVVPLDPQLGMATLADGAVLTFITTLLTHRLNLGEPLTEDIMIRPTALLRALGRDRGGHGLKLFAASVDRLGNTQVNTDLSSDGRRSHVFTLLEGVERAHGDAHGPWRLILPSFLIEQVAARRILQIDPAALRLRGLERRLYGWARAYAGGKAHDTWTLSLGRAHTRAASQDARRKFCHVLGSIVQRNRLPGFSLALNGRGPDANLTITRRLPGTSSSVLPLPATADALADPDDGVWI